MSDFIFYWSFFVFIDFCLFLFDFFKDFAMFVRLISVLTHFMKNVIFCAILFYIKLLKNDFFFRDFFEL